MANEDGTIWLVFNGEIYNYRELADTLRARGHLLRTRTDSEVIIHAWEEWGRECVQRFNGMFAFALWDTRREALFCARDRFGVKPFYFARPTGGDGILFASEIKPLLRHPLGPARRANDRAIFDFLVAGRLDHTDGTCFEGIDQLPAAHTLLASRSGIEIRRYWDIPAQEGDPLALPSASTRQRWAETLADLLEDAVRLRLHADVPVGTCLSGGLDSSSIVCLANRLLFAESASLPWRDRGERQKTFSACYDDSRHDERGYIDQIVAATGADPTYVFPGRQDALAELIPAVVWHQEEPFGSTSILAQWHVMEAAARRGMTVLLDGQGADELLAGYHGYFGAALADDLLRPSLPRFAGDLRGYRAQHDPSWRQVARITLDGLLPQRSPLWRPIRALPSVRGNATGWLAPAFAEGRTVRRPRDGRTGGRLDAALYSDATRTSLPALLHYEDRNSMAFSIEARTPFLDYRIAEFLFRLPNGAKLRDGTTKVVLRDAMRDVLPEPVRVRRDKKGFSTPEERWLGGELREWTMDILQSRTFAERGFVAPKAAQALFADLATGTSNDRSIIWRVLNVELWARMFLDRAPSAAPAPRRGPVARPGQSAAAEWR